MAAINRVRRATTTRPNRSSKLLTGKGLDRDLVHADSVSLPLQGRDAAPPSDPFFGIMHASGFTG